LIAHEHRKSDPVQGNHHIKKGRILWQFELRPLNGRVR
jgi:hypothetical protein